MYRDCQVELPANVMEERIRRQSQAELSPDKFRRQSQDIGARSALHGASSLSRPEAHLPSTPFERQLTNVHASSLRGGGAVTVPDADKPLSDTRSRGKRTSTQLPQGFARGHEGRHAVSHFAGGTTVISDVTLLTDDRVAALQRRPTSGLPKAYTAAHAQKDTESHFDGGSMVLSPRADAVDTSPPSMSRLRVGSVEAWLPRGNAAGFEGKDTESHFVGSSMVLSERAPGSLTHSEPRFLARSTVVDADERRARDDVDEWHVVAAASAATPCAGQGRSTIVRSPPLATSLL